MPTKQKKTTSSPGARKKRSSTTKKRQPKQKTILVTGSAGFIGMYVTKQLLEEGYAVIGVDNLNNYYDPQLKRKRNAILLKHPKYRFFRIDIANDNRMRSLFSKYAIDQVCHLAAQAGVRYSLDHPFTYEESNNKGTLTLFELCKEHGVRDIVYASSSSVYGNTTKAPFKESASVDQPVSLYAATKRYGELLASTYHSLYGLNMIGLRFFTVYGPYGRPDMALFRFTKNILEGTPIDIYNKGNLYRDFTYVTDIVQGVISALKKASSLHHEIINLGNNAPVKLTTFIGQIEKALGKKGEKRFLPMQKGDVYKTAADLTKAKKLLGYTPRVSLEEGIISFVEWYRTYYEK